MLTVVLVLALNIGISWWNCYAVGGMWEESKALGGFPRLIAWCAATQSVIGFSSVIGAVLGYALFVTGHLPPKAAHAAAALWYLIVILPAIGTGLVLTIYSWIMAYRERDLLSMGTAAWNTFAQIHNMAGAIDGIGDAFGDVGKLFDGDGDDSMVLIVFVLVAAALLGGFVLTYALIRKYSGRLPLPQRTGAAA